MGDHRPWSVLITLHRRLVDVAGAIASKWCKEMCLGSRFIAAVEDATARALAYPFTSTLASEYTRRMLFKNFLFRLCIDRMKMVCFELAHHARFSGYWRNRIDDRYQCHPSEP